MGLVSKLIEPKRQIGKSERFTNKALAALIVPLLIENALQVIVGFADTIMVSYAGEATVSAVSLDSLIYTVFVYVFTAIASGGAVVVAQYIGSRNIESADRTASQLLHVSLVAGIALMALMLSVGNAFLEALYSDVESDVMSALKTYFRIVTYSFPALAVYNTGAALCRTMEKTRVTMYTSIAMNTINIAGNAIGIFALHAGARGVAVPTTISWYFAAVVMTVYCSRKRGLIHYKPKWVFVPNWHYITKILKVAVPGSIENGLFQVAKVILGTIISHFGTSQIAANGIAQTIWNISSITVLAMPSAYITVVGQATGGGNMEEAEYYIRKLTRISYLISISFSALMLITMPLFIKLYDISPYTARLVIITTIIHNTAAALLQPISSSMASGMRAAGDVKYAMYTSLFSTLFCRVAFSYLLAAALGLGVTGIALAMAIDWFIKAFLVLVRAGNGKWREHRVI